MSYNPVCLASSPLLTSSPPPSPPHPSAIKGACGGEGEGEDGVKYLPDQDSSSFPIGAGIMATV